MTRKNLFLLISLVFISLIIFTGRAQAFEVMRYEDIPKFSDPSGYIPIPNGYYDSQCPPNGRCQTAGINDSWAGVRYSNNLAISPPRVVSSGKPGEKMTVNWGIYSTGTTGYTAYRGYEVRYSLNGDSFQTYECLNATKTAVATPIGDKYICLDQKHWGYFPTSVIAVNTHLTGSEYNLGINHSRSIEFTIPYDWSGKSVKFQIVEKFCQGVGQTCDVTNMYLTSYSNQINIAHGRLVLPALDINPLTVTTSCSNIGGLYTHFRGNESTKNRCRNSKRAPDKCLYAGRILTWTDPYLDGATVRTAVWISINGSSYRLVGESGQFVSSDQYFAKIYGLLPPSKAVMFDARITYDTSYSEIFYNGEGYDRNPSSIILSPGDTIQYKVGVERWNGVLGAAGQYQKQIVYSNTLKYELPRCLVDKVTIDPTEKEFNGKDLNQEQKFTARAYFKSAQMSSDYEILSTGKYTPSPLDVTEYQQNNSNWSLENVLMGSLTGSIFKPYLSEQKQIGKIYYNLNFRPEQAAANALEALNPGSNKMVDHPWLQKVRGEAKIVINPLQQNQGETSSTSSQTLFKGIFIGQEISLPKANERSMTIEYDSNIIDNPPPGFGDLIAPNWLEKTP